MFVIKEFGVEFWLKYVIKYILFKLKKDLLQFIGGMIYEDKD